MIPARVIVIDWSAAGKPVTGKDSIWLGLTDAAGTTVENIPTRAAAEARLDALVSAARDAGERLLIGADFAFAYPAGLAAALTGRDDALALWSWLADRVTDLPGNATNYRDVAAAINARFDGDGPFWGNGAGIDVPGLPRRKPALPAGLREHRACEARVAGPARPKSVWQLAGAGAVGAQAMTGIPALHRLRAKHAGAVSVWPFEPPQDIVLAEVYPSLLMSEVRVALAEDPGLVPDAVQVRLLSQALWALRGDGLAQMMDQPPSVEGAILGAGHEIALRGALPSRLVPPRLKNDCFAMPQGVAWVPVDEALARLRAALHPVAATEECPLAEAAGRILAKPVIALRSNPPQANAAVDGYGFAHAATGSGPQRLPLVAGRAAAGQPFAGAVPEGAAVRILTGAILPPGVDTVVLEEDCATDGTAVIFHGPVKPRANTRRAGEDLAEGAVALPAGHALRAPDLALLAAVGQARVPVFRRLRVGVLSTGDEIVPHPGDAAAPHQIWDANRPMLLALARGWGHQAVDLGHARDAADAIRRRLDRAAAQVDVILTSGGASAGDEDHVSRLLRTEGTLSSWRIAMKPGRPLALAMWRGVPVIGLPGNPVAAFVCALIFGRPALSCLAGAGWVDPQGFAVPAAFSKRKKPGRREYLRARLTAEGRAEVFGSEGSGRISGLSWADGLVELPDGAAEIVPGTPVRFLPYAGFGVI